MSEFDDNDINNKDNQSYVDLSAFMQSFKNKPEQTSQEFVTSENDQPDVDPSAMQSPVSESEQTLQESAISENESEAQSTESDNINYSDSPENNQNENEQTENDDQSESSEPATTYNLSEDADKSAEFDSTMFIDDELQQSEPTVYKTNQIVKKKKKGLFKTEEYIVAPEKALEDDISESDILSEMEKIAEEEKQEEDDEESYEGLSEEEIAEIKERKRVLNELKQRYDTKATKKTLDNGDYKKNLDFTVNTSIRQFKVKPPKKPFIISAIVIAALMILAAVITLILLNKPPEPVKLTGISLSQETTYQLVDEQVDIRGLKLKLTYSDGSTKKIDVKDSMITSSSTNIDQNMKIFEYSDETFVNLTYSGFTAKLNIVLSELVVNEISSFEIYDIVYVNSTIDFDNILIIGKIIDSISETVYGYQRIDASLFDYAIDSDPLEKTEDGVVIPEIAAGSHLISISLTVGENTLIKNIQIVIYSE